mgnify:CR=1 FL=1
MDKFTAHFIPWKDWNKQITILNSLNKAFYREAKFYTKKEPDDSLFMDHEFYATFGFTSRDENKVIHFSAKKERVLGVITRSGFFEIEENLSAGAKSLPRVYGWVTIVRAAVGDTNGETIINDRGSNLVNVVFDAFNLDHYTFSYRHEAKNKWSSLPKEVQEWRDEQATHTDRYNIPIEIGDYIAYTMKDSKYVTIEKVNKITETRVNGVEPFKITVVRAKNHDKKLGW